MDINKTVSVIEPKISVIEDMPEAKYRKRRVAGYARVSTEKDEQQGSFEAQIDYFTKLISQNEDWEFVGIYADEGLSGTSTRMRKSFNRMVNDALASKIDLIVTKSISRFARNTVDSLTTIRLLKDAGCECYFEKENIYTFDPKGELLITILSSLAQEESRSLSENVTWGARKRFADGKYTIHYSEFLGYRKGEDGLPEIDGYEASVVRRIYYMCVEGLGLYRIAGILTREGIKTPMGKSVWGYSVVRSILQNEKYVGDALLQKTYSTSFLTKKRCRNNGEVKQYYVENGHPAIVSRELFAEVQKTLEDRKPSRFRRNDKPYSKRLRCAFCGNWYLETVWHPHTKSEKKVWRCGSKNKKGLCKAPWFTYEQAEALIVSAARRLTGDQALYLSLLPGLCVSERVLEACRLERAEIERTGGTAENSPRLRELNAFLAESEELNRAIGEAVEKNSVSDLPPDTPNRLLDYLTVYDRNHVTARYILTESEYEIET